MGFFLVVIIVIGVVVVVGMAVWGRSVRRRPAGAPRVTRDVIRRSSMPSPGEPSPTRHGRPVPGSRADRARHGKP